MIVILGDPLSEYLWPVVVGTAWYFGKRLINWLDSDNIDLTVVSKHFKVRFRGRRGK